MHFLMSFESGNAITQRALSELIWSHFLSNGPTINAASVELIQTDKLILNPSRLPPTWDAVAPGDLVPRAL